MTAQAHPVPEAGGTLLVRVWTESGSLADLRVRVLAASGWSPVQSIAHDVGVDALFGVIQSWLDGIVRSVNDGREADE